MTTIWRTRNSAWPRGTRVKMVDREQFPDWRGSRLATVVGMSKAGLLTVQFDGKKSESSGWHPDFFKRVKADEAAEN